MGISWLLAIYNVWLANFGVTAKCLLLSQGQVEAQDLLSKVAFVHEHLPAYIKFPTDNENREYLSFKGNYSVIRALASTDKAGHGFQGTCITRDEVARHPYARENFVAVARAGGRLIELSTANKTDPANYFQEKTSEYYHDPNTQKKVLPSGLELYTNVTKPKTCLVFLPWQLRPTRDEGMTVQEWYEKRIIPNFTPLQIEEQFPTKIEDVFKESGVKAYFEEQTLDDMSYEITHPIKQAEVQTYNGIIRVYKPPIVGRRYVVYTDPSLGVADPFVTRVKDCATGERVASASAIIKVDFAAQIHDYLVRTYNKAWNSFEYNGSSGGEFANVLKDLNTPNQQMRRDHEGKIIENRKGLYVTPPLKKVMMERLNFMVSKRQIINHDKEFIGQARRVLRDSGLPVMDKHQPFDWIMADAGLEWVDKFVPKGTVKVESVRDL